MSLLKQLNLNCSSERKTNQHLVTTDPTRFALCTTTESLYCRTIVQDILKYTSRRQH